QVTYIQDGVDQFRNNVNRISELHARTLDSTDEAANRQTQALLEDLVNQTRELSNDLKRRIQSLDSIPTGRPQDARIRKNQLALLRSKFVEVLQSYQQVERDYRARYKQRVERQFRIVKPDATPEEVRAVVDDTSGGGDQIFAQALSVSDRYREGRAAYREVQERHDEIRKIEQTLEELAQMFNDMSVLINQQDESLDAIQMTAGRVEADTTAGLQQTEKAVEHARSARRKRWICFWLTVLIVLIIVGIVVGVVVSQNVSNNHKNNSGSGNNTSSG
ncbi:t-SNARE, partial [Obba rivulosa]